MQSAWTLIALSVGLAQAAEASGTSTVTATASAAATATAAAVLAVDAAPTAPTAPELPPPAAEAPLDHASVVGRIGVGFVGARTLALGTLDNAFAAPTLGARLWLSERWGVEVGVGLGHQSGTVAVQLPGATTTTLDAETRWGLAVQVGVPLAIAWGQHYTFVATPEARLGHAWSVPGGDPNRPETDDGDHGTTFEVGARGGAELHFGFIGVPELALEASVGVFLRYVDVGTTRGTRVDSGSQFTLATTSYQDPWDFFRTSIAARYYF